MKLTRAAIYARGNEPEHQVGVAAAFIIDHNLIPYGMYVDEDDHGAWEQLKDDYANWCFDMVIVQDSDVLPEDECQSGKAYPFPIIIAEYPFCINADLDLESFEYEIPERHQTLEHREALSNSVRKTILVRKAEGNSVGFIPFGYKRVDGKLVPDQDKKELVYRIFCQARDGIEFTRIAAWLDDNGIETPKGSSRWSDTTIRDILRNDVYVGTSGIIDRELFHSVQERFKRIEPVEKRGLGVYQGLVYCGACNRRMAYHGIGGKAGRKTAIYSCKYHTGAKPKEVPLDHMPMIEEKTLQAEVEKQVNDYIRHLSVDRDVLDSAIQKRMALMKPIESKIRDFGEKFLKQEEASWEGYFGLWKQWRDARRNYSIVSHMKDLMIDHFEGYQPDDQKEKYFVQSITVFPDKTVSVNIPGSIMFDQGS